MADLKYRVTVDTSGAQAALNNLSRTAENLTGIFQGLIAVLGTRELIQFADAITSVRNRLNQLAPTQEAVNKQFLAIAAIAINARAPLESVSDLYFRIARNADALGISQQEAADITESVAKAISASGLSAAEASGPLLQLGQALQSGRFQGDELRSILEGLPPVARALADSLGVPIGALKEMGAQGLITGKDFVNAMRQARDAIEQDFARTVPTIGQAFENVKTAFKILYDEFEQGSGTGQQLAVILEDLAARIFFLRESVDELIGPLTTVIKVLAALLAFSVVGRVFRGIAAAVTAATSSVKGFLGLVTSIGGGIAAYLGVEEAAEGLGNVGKEGTASAERIKRFREEMAKLKNQLPKEAGPGAPAFIDPVKLAKARDEIIKISEQYQRTLSDQQKRLELENSLVGATEQQRQIKTALADLESGYLKTVTDLMSKYREASISGKEEDAAKLKEIEQQLQVVSEAYGKQIDVVRQLTEENFRLNEAYKQRQALTDFTYKTEIDLAKKLRDLQYEMATVTMTAQEKKYYDIVKAAQDSAQAAIDTENSRRRAAGIAKMTAAEEQKYRDAALKGTERVLEAQRQIDQESRKFSTGWKRAMKEYIEEATNGAKKAESIFKKATQGMEDVIVNFAKTGKFEWKGFVASMLEELLRAQIQQIFAGLMGSMTQTMQSGGGILDTIGSLFGMGGNSGNTSGGILDTIGNIFGGGGGAPGSSANNPLYVVPVGGSGFGAAGGIFGGMPGTGQSPGQSQGGGILDTVWTGIKDVGSSIWEGVKSVGSGVWDAVSGIGSAVGSIFSGGGGGGGGSFIDDIVGGIGDFFGGFFANGGNLAAGKFGVVGENGPEFVSGPASITPMSGTNVTYNINAVDAMSFKQMLAQDPSFIYGLTIQGSKGVPARR